MPALPSLTRVREVLDYNPETGNLFWKVATSKKIVPGSLAGSRAKGGYWQIRIDKKRYVAHRVIWLWCHGTPPDDEIDHINGIRDDNRIANLRLATSMQNKCNQRRRENKTSQYKGVSWCARLNRWQAHIAHNHEHYYLGLFHDELAAHEAYCKRAVTLHGVFARAA